MSRPMSTSRLSPDSGHRSGSAMSSSSRVDAIVSWFPAAAPPLASSAGPPAVADEALLDRQLGGLRELALALASAGRR